jgi:hypothetical protein
MRDADGRLVIVQCKRYASGTNVTAPDVQAFYGMVVLHRAARGIDATTSGFTKGATALALDCDIELVDGSALAWEVATSATLPVVFRLVAPSRVAYGLAPGSGGGTVGDPTATTATGLAAAAVAVSIQAGTGRSYTLRTHIRWSGFAQHAPWRTQT